MKKSTRAEFGLQFDVEIALGVVSAKVQPLELVRFG
jgi:hypothetical protein